MKAVIYSRKSKFREEGESIENQINMCIKYADVNLGITDYDIFEDEGFSGKNTDRPQFQLMLKNIKAKKYTHFICYRLDRAFRNVSDYSTHMELFKKYGVAFVSIKEQFDTTTAMGRAMMNVSATFAQLERETTAERIKDNLRELSKTGRWLGGPSPLGYNSIEVENTDGKGKSRKKHILQINSNEEYIPKLVFELFLEYKSFQRVSRILESRGIYSRTGKVFSRELVKQTLLNPIYIISDTIIIDYLKSLGCETYISNDLNSGYGLMPYNRRKENGSWKPIKDWIISVGDHPGLITSTDWIKSYEIIKNINKENISNRKGTSKDSLLSGLVVCAKCGYGMSPRRQTCKQANGSETIYRYYSCNLRNKSSKRCNNVAVDAYMAEDYVIDKLLNISDENIIESYNECKNKAAKRIDNINIIEKLNKEISNNKEALSKLVLKLAYLEDDPEIIDIVKQEIKKIKDKNIELQDKINAIELENESINTTNQSIDEILELFHNFKKFYNYAETFQDKKRLIRTVVKFVTWDSETRILEVIPIGSSKERPTSHLPLSNRSRRISSY